MEKKKLGETFLEKKITQCQKGQKITKAFTLGF
jgi:hypothetical protein